MGSYFDDRVSGGRDVFTMAPGAVVGSYWSPSGDAGGCGVVWFIVTCLAILLAQNIEQFTLLRFLQGISLCFIGAVGYAAIQESFEEAVCIKITALMANVALIAPLLGPLVGAAWIHVLPWEGMFVLFAALAAISFFGLQLAMPETATRIGEKLSLKELGRDYKLVLKNGRFVAGALALGFVSLPLLAWIAQSPIIIITGEQLSSYEYGLLQVPIFGALIAGNLLLARLTSRRTVRSLIIMGGWPIMIGLLVAAAATVISSHAYLWMTAGLSIYAFGIGLAKAIGFMYAGDNQIDAAVAGVDRHHNIADGLM